MTTRLKIARHGDRYRVEWDEWEDQAAKKIDGGYVVDSQRLDDHDARAVLEEMHNRLSDADVELRPEGTDVPMLVAVASPGTVASVTGRILESD
jgi:hypothetical protein